MRPHHEALRGHYRKADRLLLLLQAALVIFGLAVALLYGNWAGCLASGALAAVGQLLARTRPGRRPTRLSLAVLTMLQALLLLDQSGGNAALQLAPAVVLATSLFHRDWQVVAAAALTYGLGLLVSAVAPETLSLYAGTYSGAESALFVGVAALGAVTLGWIARGLDREVLQDAELKAVAASLLADPQVFDLTNRNPHLSSTTGRGINTFLTNLDATLGRVKGAVVALGAADRRMTELTHRTSRAGSSQQATVQDVSALVQGIHGTLEQAAAAARHAADGASETHAQAREGEQLANQAHAAMASLADVVTGTSSSMAELNTQSERIEAMLDVIRGVAEQTNLLALNAAIEAARAGEQGRGFAVVADEVRTLASRTQESTREIQTIIEALREGTQQCVAAMHDSQHHALKSATSVGAVTNQLSAICTRMGEVNNLTADIATDAAAQLEQTGAVHAAMAGLEQVSADCVDSSTEGEQVCRELDQLAVELAGLVGRFRVSADGDPQ